MTSEPPMDECLKFLSFLVSVCEYIDEFMDSSAQDLAQCCYRLLDSDLFQNNTMSITDTIIDRAIEVRSHLLSWGYERRIGCINAH